MTTRPATSSPGSISRCGTGRTSATARLPCGCSFSTGEAVLAVPVRPLADRVAGRPQGVLDLADAERAEVEDARREYRVRAGVDRGGEVGEGAGAAAGDDGDRDGVADQADQLKVEACLGAVGVHRVEQDLARAQFGGAAGPVDGVDAGAGAAAV